DPDDDLRREQFLVARQQRDPLPRGRRSGLDALDALRADGCVPETVRAGAATAPRATAPGLPIGMPVTGGGVGRSLRDLRHGGFTVPGTYPFEDARAAYRLTSVQSMSETGVMGAAAGTGPDGLTAAEVAQRVRAGQVNVVDEHTSRTFAEIVRANVLTRFNAILATAFVLILIFGEGQDALFGFVLLFNILIGVIQEYRAKRTLDRLAVLNAPRARVVRDGNVQEIAVSQVVIDDLCELRAGDQVPADGVLRAVDGLELDESLLTGESDPVSPGDGDEVLSGSIAVAGQGR